VLRVCALASRFGALLLFATLSTLANILVIIVNQIDYVLLVLHYALDL